MPKNPSLKKSFRGRAVGVRGSYESIRPVLAAVMTGTYEQSGFSRKGSYERVMNGDAFFPV